MQNRAHWAATIDAAIAALDTAPLGEVQAFCAGVRAKVDAFESRRLAAEMRPDEDERPTRRKAAAGGNRSRREAAKAAKRAAAVKKNPRLADDMDSGKLSSEQADKDKTQTEHDRQHNQRRVSTYVDAHRGTDALKIEGSKAAIAELRNRIELRERQLWEADGGRDLARGDDKRSRDPRLFDAAYDIIVGTSGSSSRSRPAAVININANNPNEPAEMVGVGPILTRSPPRSWSGPTSSSTSTTSPAEPCGGHGSNAEQRWTNSLRWSHATKAVCDAAPTGSAARSITPCRPKRPDRNSQPATVAEGPSGRQPPTEITTPAKKSSKTDSSDDEAA